MEEKNTLGEEIINLTKKGVDKSTVERLYKKYLDIITDTESKKTIEECCRNDKALLNNIWMHIYSDKYRFAVGDKVNIPLGELGTFTATVHRVIDGGAKVLFLFDDYITKRPMYSRRYDTNGYENSDLKAWIDTELYNSFPEWIRPYIHDLSIPTYGEIHGWNDDPWAKIYIEPDSDEQLPLMKYSCDRTACYNGVQCECCGWLRNKAKEDRDSFAIIDKYGRSGFNGCSLHFGVRPEFWLYV